MESKNMEIWKTKLNKNLFCVTPVSVALKGRFKVIPASFSFAAFYFVNGSETKIRWNRLGTATKRKKEEKSRVCVCVF